MTGGETEEREALHFLHPSGAKRNPEASREKKQKPESRQ
jgi:hypothetical protein